MYDDGIKKQFLYLPCHTDDHLAFRVIPYIFTLCRNFAILTKSLSCLPRMVNTRANPASQEQAEGSEGRNENLPHPPSLAEVMMEAERNKRETNRLLERI